MDDDCGFDYSIYLENKFGSFKSDDDEEIFFQGPITVDSKTQSLQFDWFAFLSSFENVNSVSDLKKSIEILGEVEIPEK